MQCLLLSWGYIFYFHLFFRLFKLDLASVPEMSFRLQIVSLLTAITYSFHRPYFTPFIFPQWFSLNFKHFFSCCFFFFFHFYIILLSSNLSFLSSYYCLWIFIHSQQNFIMDVYMKQKIKKLQTYPYKVFNLEGWTRYAKKIKDIFHILSEGRSILQSEWLGKMSLRR